MPHQSRVKFNIWERLDLSYHLLSRMNSQQVNKVINFFRINLDFHPPYCFLIDGNFLKVLVEKEYSLEDKLKSFINGKCNLRITSCILSQLELLGEQFKIVHQKGLQIQQIPCKHPLQQADRCIKSHIDQINEGKFIVCSQDQNLRRKLRHCQTPIMYFGPDQRITMEDVEKHSLRKIQQKNRQKMLPNQEEQQHLKQYKIQQKVINKQKQKRKELKFASERGIQLAYLKKKRVMAPNPLSMKRKRKNKMTFHKQKEIQHQSEYQKVENGNQNINIPKKKRIRKKKKKTIVHQE